MAAEGNRITGDMDGYTLIDYINWRGDLTFDENPFNIVDNVILCELSYVDYTPVLQAGNPEGISFSEAFRRIKELDAFRLLTAGGGDDSLARKAAESRRFGSVLLTYWADVFDQDSIQFSAVHFELDPDVSYVAFRGTDSSLIGWKEDFMMSFRMIPAQEKAVQYLSLSMRQHRKYYIGGHSKGGNLAVYAASRLSEAARGRILQIFVNDGPGFSPDVYNTAAMDSLAPIITKLVPVYGIIGRLFHMEAARRYIVNSFGKGILQHDMMTWKLKGPEFDCAERFDNGSEILCNAFTAWVANADEEARKAFVDWLFDSLSAGGAVKLGDLGVRDVPDVLKSILSPSPEAKDVVIDLPKSVLSEAGRQAQETLLEHLQQLRSQIAKLKRTDSRKK